MGKKVYPTEIVQPIGLHNSKYPCIRTEHVKEYLDLPYEFLNPVQSEFLPYLEDDETNIVVSAQTSSGKTNIAELIIARGISQGKKAIYLAPMKALADEKESDWRKPSHTFSKYQVEVITGDAALTDAKRKRLSETKKELIILMTPEMFNSKCRSFEKNKWLDNSVIIVDEAHLLGLENRGDILEVALIQYHENCPNSRYLLLSATLPNVDDFKKWLEHLTVRETVVIKSDYRPCKLEVRMHPFPHGKTYAQIEENRMKAVIELIQKHKDDESMLVFTGSKNFGYRLNSQLKALGIQAGFHNADLNKDDRHKLSDDFKNKTSNIIIASTTLSWGTNYPAKYIIQSHTCFGLTPISPANIIQAIGRAGRVGYTDKGIAYILAESTKIEKEYKRIFGQYLIRSTLQDVNILMFHILSYIVDGTIQTPEDLFTWYHKTLDSVQGRHIDEDMCKKIMDRLCSRWMICKKGDKYEATKLGIITAKYYMSPIDVSDWFSCFGKLSTLNPSKGLSVQEERHINLQVAVALASCYSFGRTWKNENGERVEVINKNIYITEAERNTKEVMEVGEALGVFNVKDSPYLKYAGIFYSLLNGEDISPALNSIYLPLSRDFERTISTLQQCDKMVGSNFKKSGKCEGYGWSSHEWDLLCKRLQYGVRTSLLDLIDIPGVGKKRAEKLELAGITTKSQLMMPEKFAVCKKALGEKTYQGVLEHLRSIF